MCVKFRSDRNGDAILGSPSCVQFILHSILSPVQTGGVQFAVFLMGYIQTCLLLQCESINTIAVSLLNLIFSFKWTKYLKEKSCLDERELYSMMNVLHNWYEV
jgi:hypothetical protein